MKTYSSSRHTYSDFFVSIAATFVHVILNGYFFSHMMPLIATLAKAYGRQDLFQNDLIHGLFLKSFLIPFLSFCDKLGLLETASFVLHVLSICLTFVVILKIARLICMRRGAAYLALLFLILAKPMLGGIDVFQVNFTYRTLALPIVLLSFYLALNKRYIFSALLLGLSTNIHALSAVPVFLFLSYSFVRDARGPRERLLAALAFLATSAPFIIFYVLPFMQHSGPMFMEGEWLEAIRIRSSHHFFPPAGPTGIYAAVLFLSSILIIFGCYRPETGARKSALLFSKIILGTMFFYFLIVNYLPLAGLVQLQLYRGTIFLFIISLFFLSDHVLDTYFSGSIFSKCRAVGLAAALCLNFFFLFLGFVLFEIAMKLGWTKKPLSKMIALCIIIALGAVFYNKADLLNKDTHITRRGLKRVDMPFTFAPWLISLRNLYQWCEAHTSRDGVFIVPPTMRGFRYYTERSIVGNWKDGTLAIYSPRLASQWLERMYDLKCLDRSRPPLGSWADPCGCAAGYASLTAADISYLSEKYGARYLIVDNGRELPFPKLYSEGPFRVYESAPSGSEDSNETTP